ncbi:ABC transporter substrate-binding protein [Hahella aquimaris]|uniref:ABC transporter substrate-binding protein n=1 Tax=Hahella sp. HNIBRBA332 TaxID=3015983 RepID=UPI00273ACF48|nr:ABC transporter substrate-binding protein [Hahella sp. HNIBRBA332]WLQ17325.1 ABC transporter substrate-binding protein [Hahella sp. HNIBRBA332]
MSKKLLVGLLSLLPFMSPAALAADEKFVAITQIVEHPALDACRKGVQDELAERGFKVGENLKWMYESAQGNPTTANQIAKKFAGEEPDVIVAIATPSAITAAAAARNTPVVFSAVTDPLGAKLVKTLKKPGGKVTGTMDMLPIDKHLQLVKRIVPDVKTIGTIYNPGEANSVSLVERLKEESASAGLILREAAVTKSSEILNAARSLVGKVDAIYLLTDNTVISGVEAVIKVGEQNKLPVIAADTDTVTRGAIAAYGFNYYDVGRQTGGIVADILEGKAPGDIDVQGVEKLELYLNPGAAERMGVKLDPKLSEEAKEIVGG